MTDNERILIEAGTAILASFQRYQKAFGVEHRGECDCPRCVEIASWCHIAERVKVQG